MEIFSPFMEMLARVRRQPYDVKYTRLEEVEEENQEEVRPPTSVSTQGSAMGEPSLHPDQVPLLSSVQEEDDFTLEEGPNVPPPPAPLCGEFLENIRRLCPDVKLPQWNVEELIDVATWPSTAQLIEGPAHGKPFLKLISTEYSLWMEIRTKVSLIPIRYWVGVIILASILLPLLGGILTVVFLVTMWITFDATPKFITPRVIKYEDGFNGEEVIFKRLDIPQDVKWREPTTGVKIRNTSEYAEAFALQFELELSEDGYYVDTANEILIPKVSSAMIGQTLYFYPSKRHVKRTIGMFDLIVVNEKPNKTRLPGIALGFVGTIWGLVDNDSYARCKNMTFISNDSGFNAVTEIKNSWGRSWLDVWTIAFITEERRLARMCVPDMPLSTRTRPPPALHTPLWESTNKWRLWYGLEPVMELSFEASYLSGVVELDLDSCVVEIEECSVPTIDPQPVSKQPECSDLIVNDRATDQDLKRIDEEVLEEHLRLEECSEDPLDFKKGLLKRPAVEYIVSNGKVIMNPAVIKSELHAAHLQINLDDWKSTHSRQVVYMQAFGKLGYSPAPTSHNSLLTETVRQKPLQKATQNVDLRYWNFSEGILRDTSVLTRKISLPKFDPVPMDQVGETEAELKARIALMGNSKTRERMSKVLSEFYGCQIEVMEITRNSQEKFVPNNKVWLVLVTVKIFTKGDELIMKAKPRSIKFPQSWFWLVTVLNLESQLAAIKSDRYWSWRPEPEVPFRLYWASGMTQQRLSEAWTHAISNLPTRNANFEITSGEYFSFICGDDNSDELGAADASAYDSTQREFFASCQFASMQGFEDAVIASLKRIHKGKRNGRGFSYIQQQMGNPSGSPFTLFINSLGMGIYTLERARWRIRLESIIKRELIPEEMDRLSKAVGTAYGLEITYTPAPVTGTIGEGIEFLKGAFICRSGSSGAGSSSAPPGSYIWVPLPSRIIKGGKIIIDNDSEKLSPASLSDRVTSVANSYCTAVIPPLLSEWVDVWKGTTKRKFDKGWQNVLFDADSEFLKANQDAAFQEQCSLVFAHRYGYSKEELILLQQEIRKRGRTFGHFTGGLWDRLALVDYQGQVF